MPFNPNIPNPADLLSSSQGDLLNNNGFLQTWSVTDHYGLDDATSNNGKHQVIQMPVQATQPVTTVDPMLYSFQQTTGNAGILQYMCQAGGLVQSPITPIQSSATGITLIASTGQTTIFDFSGTPDDFPFCFGYVTTLGTPSGGNVAMASAIFGWNGSQGVVNNYLTNTFQFEFSGSLLKLFNTNPLISLTNVAWTLVFNRIFTPT